MLDPPRLVLAGSVKPRFGYSNERLFQGVSFRLELGERAGLVAPNGAGKSTLLRVIAGELDADEGTVTLKKGSSLGYYRQGRGARGRQRWTTSWPALATC